jgi:hypothetical protein
MNRDDGITIIARLMAAWPGHEWSDPTAEMWLEDLEAWHLEEAMAAVQMCRRTLDWSPSWHQFLEALAAARRTQSQTIYRAELTRPGVHTPEANIEAIRLIRNWYANKTNMRLRHWHGGPDPCPICGGLNPKVEQAQELENRNAGAADR